MLFRSYANSCYRPWRSLDVGVRYNDSTGAVAGYYFDLPTKSNFEPVGDMVESEDKTLYDVVNCFLQTFNVVIDDITLNNQPVIRLARWDDIDKSEVVDWSGMLTGTPRFKPSIDGYAQKSIIKYDSVYEGGSELAGAKTITSNNKNLDPTTDLFSVDAYYPGVINVKSYGVLDLSKEDSFKSNMVLIDSGLKDQIPVYHFDTLTNSGATLFLNIAAIYGIENEYRLLDTINKYPKWYEITKWLTINDLLDIQFFKQYFIRELGASFFINKISGFNPSKGLQPTKIELIKISEKTPLYPEDLDFWADGIVDPWTDGINDYFY